MTTSVRIRRMQTTIGPKLGQPKDVETIQIEARAIDGGHFDVYPCVGCGAQLMTRATRAVVMEHSGAVCPRCPVSGVITSLAEETRISGFKTLGQGDIATLENGSPISAKTQANQRGFSGTTKRGGRPTLSPEERRRRERDRKRRQRGISAPAAEDA